MTNFIEKKINIFPLFLPFQTNTNTHTDSITLICSLILANCGRFKMATLTLLLSRGGSSSPSWNLSWPVIALTNRVWWKWCHDSSMPLSFKRVAASGWCWSLNHQVRCTVALLKRPLRESETMEWERSPDKLSFLTTTLEAPDISINIWLPARWKPLVTSGNACLHFWPTKLWDRMKLFEATEVWG